MRVSVRIPSLILQFLNLMLYTQTLLLCSRILVDVSLVYSRIILNHQDGYIQMLHVLIYNEFCLQNVYILVTVRNGKRNPDKFVIEAVTEKKTPVIQRDF